jgi:hypothetical protein
VLSNIIKKDGETLVIQGVDLTIAKGSSEYSLAIGLRKINADLIDPRSNGKRPRSRSSNHPK